MRKELRVLGAEALYLLATAVVAGVSTLIQMIGRTYVGKHSSFIFSGNDYRYNKLFFVFGLVLFVGFMFAGYKFFLKKKIRPLRGSEAILKVLFAVVALLFSLLTFAAIVLSFFLIIGITDNMLPESMFQMTVFSWPVFTLVFMIIVEIINCKGESSDPPSQKDP
ncbi:MAG: hypothetical protein J5636_02840 [Clostridiales bacterium]|nr:hypothetical protein [Clostridiales bacterium]